MDHYIYIDNNKNISNKSRYTESTILQNEKDKCSQNIKNQLPLQKLEENSQCNNIKSIHDEQQVDNISVLNLDSINQLLLKLAGKYSNHHFGHKKVLMDYMAKALFHELSKEDTQANSCSTQSQSHNLNKAQEQYLNERGYQIFV